MTVTMAYYEDMETVLCNAFQVVVQFWDAGNFKGYIAAQSEEPVAAFLRNLIPLDSGYNTVDTPEIIRKW